MSWYEIAHVSCPSYPMADFPIRAWCIVLWFEGRGGAREENLAIAPYGAYQSPVEDDIAG
jgi:hypothetical protein